MQEARPAPMIEVKGLTKTYGGGFTALKSIDLDIRRGEIFALLGPNGAGKTTLISIICGLVNPSSGHVRVAGHDIISDFRAARSYIGLVPQELTNEAFSTVWDSVSFSRGLFGKPRNPAHIEQVLRSLSLWDKRKNRLITLSGGMKRRVLIAKALAHEPDVLFLDEPTAGVDVELRRDMWEVVRELRDNGVTIILTTHYIEEAEEMADRIGVIRSGELVLVEEKHALMRSLGRKELTLQLRQPLDEVPESLTRFGLALADDGHALVYTYDDTSVTSDSDGHDGGEHGTEEHDIEGQSGIAKLLAGLDNAGVGVKDLYTRQSSLEEIFVSLVQERKE
ncbi:ABC transporter ATP-binding protein [Halomonas binhaiensis]|uniref:ABC transporter ATP-binding protein n=1 Tax=Halomonas binhaiensis TaxID=2562282 RepID=A0A5C1NF06_9GAMM|nr:ABC transporter ATP-binding protein [Halomonas binhaiensis]QEM81451.1 ABC transporter ATP-binding protein [Halomonas binhaiensis]